LHNGSSIAVQEALKEGKTNGRRVEAIRVGDELRPRGRPGEAHISQDRGDRIGDNYAATTAGLIPQHVVNLALAPQFDAIETRLESVRQLRVGRREHWRGFARQTTVAEQKAERIRVDGNDALREPDRSGKKRQLEAMLMRGVKATDHLPGFEHPTRLTTAAVGCRENMP
jgi:hypothetical protein